MADKTFEPVFMVESQKHSEKLSDKYGRYVVPFAETIPNGHNHNDRHTQLSFQRVCIIPKTRLDVQALVHSQTPFCVVDDEHSVFVDSGLQNTSLKRFSPRVNSVLVLV